MMTEGNGACQRLIKAGAHLIEHLAVEVHVAVLARAEQVTHALVRYGIVNLSEQTGN